MNENENVRHGYIYQAFTSTKMKKNPKNKHRNDNN